MDGNITQDTLDLLKGAIPGGDDMIKAWVLPNSPTTGLQEYDLQKAVLSLVPVETPLVNKFPMVDGEGGSQANWKAIVNYDASNIDIPVSEGNRGGVANPTTADYFAAYCTLGKETSVTDEANWAARNYVDLLAIAQTKLLLDARVRQERLHLGGLGTYSLGQAAQPTAADVGTGGAIAANTTVSVIVAGLTLAGWRFSTVATGVPGLVSRTNADGTTDTYGGGTGKPSANRAVATANDGNATHCISASVAPLNGAIAYAWFWGPAGSEVLGAITTINSVLITGAAAGTQTAASLAGADNSRNQLGYDGLLSQIFKPGFGGYVATQATGTAGTGTPLTADGDGGIVEINLDLQYYYDNFRITPAAIWVSSQEQRNIGKKIAQGPGSGTSNMRFTRDVTSGQLIGAVIARAYLNPFTAGITGGDQAGAEIPIKLHPDLPPGTIMYETEKLPYPDANVDNIVQFKMQQGWTATLWPRRTRKYEFGVYARGVLQNFFIPGFGVRTNIGNG